MAGSNTGSSLIDKLISETAAEVSRHSWAGEEDVALYIPIAQSIAELGHQKGLSGPKLTTFTEQGLAHILDLLETSAAG